MFPDNKIPHLQITSSKYLWECLPDVYFVDLFFCCIQIKQFNHLLFISVKQPLRASNYIQTRQTWRQTCLLTMHAVLTHNYDSKIRLKDYDSIPILCREFHEG